jgi:hypothetical protein
MKFSAIVCATLLASASAFAPSSIESRSTTSLEAVDRRVAFGQMAAGAAGIVGASSLSAPAFADGAVSNGTRLKARVIYGARILDLEAAVKAGDFKAVAAEKNAFVLFNSGVYSSPKTKTEKKQAIKDVNAIFAAIRSKDQAALSTAYKAYVADNNIVAIPDLDGGKVQSYSSDFGYLAKTKSAAIYVR